MSDKLIYSRFYHPRDGQAWRWYIKDLITDFPRVIKYSWQRARRGWADCDVWSIDYWFQRTVPGMLRQLARRGHGLPMEFNKNETAWLLCLNQIASDLEATLRHDEKWFGEDSLYETELLDQCSQEELDAMGKVRAGVYGFYEYFWSLWD